MYFFLSMNFGDIYIALPRVLFPILFLYFNFFILSSRWHIGLNIIWKHPVYQHMECHRLLVQCIFLRKIIFQWRFFLIHRINLINFLNVHNILYVMLKYWMMNTDLFVLKIFYIVTVIRDESVKRYLHSNGIFHSRPVPRCHLASCCEAVSI